jgi:hypothetical protein
MTWLDGCRRRLVLFGFVASIGLGSGSTRADFTFGGPTNLGPEINTEKRADCPSIATDGLSAPVVVLPQAPSSPAWLTMCGFMIGW